MNVRSVAIDLIDICNLNCAYCLRDEASLHGRAHALPISELERILDELKETSTGLDVQFTGGEPTLHPDIRGAFRSVHERGWRFSVITNGWTFSRTLPHLLEFRESLRAVAFSIDGFDRADHDEIRGKGSFDRVMQAVLACRQHKLPFLFKVTMDRRKAGLVSRFVDFSARLGAERLQLGPLLPANRQSIRDVMNVAQQQAFLTEVARLRLVYRLPIELGAGFFSPSAEPTCGPLLGHTVNVDYNSRLGVCSVLAGFRGQEGDRDVVADLRTVPMRDALDRLSNAIAEQNRRRKAAFQAFDHPPKQVPLRLGSSCFDCLCSFGKIRPEPFDLVEEMLQMRDDLSFSVSDSVITSAFDGAQALLLDTATQRYYTLNETATFLWAEIEKEHTVSEMVAALREAFEVDDNRARASVVAALRRFESQKLISTIGSEVADGLASVDSGVSGRTQP